MTFSHIRHTSVGENIFRSLTNPKTHFPTGKTIASRKTRSATFAEEKKSRGFLTERLFFNKTGLSQLMSLVSQDVWRPKKE